MTTDTSEKGLEALICTALAGYPCEPYSGREITDARRSYGGVGWSGGSPRDYDCEYCVDRVQLVAFLHETQPEIAKSLRLEEDGPTRRKFLARLRSEISKHGTIGVLRNGIRHGPHNLNLFYGTPSPGNERARQLFDQNRFTVTRQLRYSLTETQRSLDITLFINGLPVFTFELKNKLTKQTVDDAVQQYIDDRDPHEKLFELGRCVAHFAVDEAEVRFCTHLKGKASTFLPFNQGWNDGAGNPPNPNGIKTEFLWRDVFVRESVVNILENYAQIVKSKDQKTGQNKRVQIWPRYHQLDVVRRLLADVHAHGVGKRYLIQHSAGSGKSNSIAWLAHQLIGVLTDGKPVFESIIVVTDRRILDKQIQDTIRQFSQVGAILGFAKHSGDLRSFLESGKKIIVSTVQKFPFILDEIGNEQRGRNFAIIIDEAHSSQGGRTSAAVTGALSDSGRIEGFETYEDQINRLMESRKMLTNASYFAFTATPKNKTLEMFGDQDPQPDGKTRHVAFHSYTMKQAIQEGFILDVLSHYMPVTSYYRLAKTVEDDPKFDTKKAQKKLRRFVEGHEHAINLKAEIMVDHFHDQVLAQRKIGGEARAMIVTNGVDRAIQYFHAIRKYLKERGSPYEAIVAFSGKHKYGDSNVTEKVLNNFPSRKIANMIQENPYRFLICADKFQTGYDEPLLHTMYVDKTLAGIQAVQTLSRLNRSHPKKHDVFVLDFLNDSDTIQDAFEPFYRTTVLADKTDPNKLHDLQADLDYAQVYSAEAIETFVELFLGGTDRSQLDPILDYCVAVYVRELDEDAKIAFKGNAKAFLRTYAFLSGVLPYTNADWEKHSIFLEFLIRKLPAPTDDDLSAGILDAIDMESYRVEKEVIRSISLSDENGEVDPWQTGQVGAIREPEIDPLSEIVKRFNDFFGDIAWQDEDRIKQLITETIPSRVAADPAFKNARTNSDEQNARVEHDKVLAQVITSLVKDDTELFRQFMENESFRKWMTETSFSLTYNIA